MACTSGRHVFAVKTIFKTGESANCNCYHEFFFLFSCYAGMMVLKIKKNQYYNELKISEPQVSSINIVILCLNNDEIFFFNISCFSLFLNL